MSVQQQRQLRNRHGASLVSRAMALALAPALYAGSLAGRVLQLPLRVAVFWLQLADTLLCDLLAFLTRQPGHKAQVRALLNLHSCSARPAASVSPAIWLCVSTERYVLCCCRLAPTRRPYPACSSRAKHSRGNYW